ncbi:MerR family transcriptional regulator [Thalassospira marina]|uniref:MerR family transcriptional regulator n=1 Tax=Thalassospira marina TaxID=2048283 RepID=A0ABM6QBU1_9PROT|nr:MerR family transcriptional regulator [Thalassospira marina]AUG54008.1 MerR family transcriptional regulator [Thalassospira marina]
MQSKDIAKRAGVTARTLRHYHQIGLLAEPVRAANGYRHYTIQHLIRLLRIKRLSALGLTLSELAPLLEDGDAQRSEILDQLDASLADKIERLNEQKQLIATLRGGTGPLDVSPELGAALFPLETGRSNDAKNSGREQSTLIDQMVNAKGRLILSELYSRLAAPDMAEIVLTLGQRFDRLGTDINDREVLELVDDYIQHLGDWMKEYNATISQFAQAETNLVLWTHALEATTPQQRRVLTEIGLRLISNGGSTGASGN